MAKQKGFKVVKTSGNDTVQGKEGKPKFAKKRPFKEGAKKGSKKLVSIKGMKALLQTKDGGDSNEKHGKKRKFDSQNTDGKASSFVKKQKFHHDNKPNSSDNRKNSKKDNKGDGNKDSSKKGDKKEHNKRESQKPLPPKHRKPYFQLVEKLKQLWNKIRDRSITSTARDTILSNLLTAIQSHIVEITLRHDASRIVQTLIQFGSDQQREVILTELLTKFYEIAKSPYGHFTILKMINYGNTSEFTKKICRGLKSHFVSLGTHAIGARTVETIFQLYSSSATKHLKAEFYGKNFNIAVSEIPTSLSHLMTLLPNKRYPILDHMKDLIHKFILKDLFVFNYVHTLVWEFCEELRVLEKLCENHEEVSSSSVPSVVIPFDRENGLKKLIQYQAELTNSLIDMIPKLLSSKIGNKIICYLITIATAKDRKKIIKQFKGKVLSSLLDRYSYISIIKLLAVTDDTINIQKTLLDEIKVLKSSEQYTPTGDLIATSTQLPLHQLFLSENGHKLFLFLLSYPKSYLNTDYDQFILHQLISKTSKKDDLIRKKEYLVYLQQIIFFVANQSLKEFLVNKYASKVIEAIVYTYYSAAKGLLENIARVYTGKEPIMDTDLKEDDLIAENDADINEKEGEEDEGNEMEEEEADEQPAGNEDDEDEDSIEIEDKEQYDEQLQEAEADRLLKLQKVGAEKDNEENNQAEEEEQIIDDSANIPIAEHPTAHVLVKRLLRFEAKLQEKFASEIFADQRALTSLIAFHQKLNEEYQFHQKDEIELSSIIDHINTSLWATTKTEDNEEELKESPRYVILGTGLYQNIFQPESRDDDTSIIEHWLSTNRCCYTLFELFSIPSLYLQLEKTFSTVGNTLPQKLEDVLAENDGGKLLWRLCQHAKESNDASSNINDKKKNGKEKKGSVTSEREATSSKKTPKKK